MTTQAHLLDQAIAEWRRGNGDAARGMFQSIIDRDRENETAWIWYVYSLGTNPEKIAALERFLELFPHNAVGEKALKSLQAEEAAKAPPASVLASLPKRKETPMAQPAISSARQATSVSALASLPKRKEMPMAQPAISSVRQAPIGAKTRQAGVPWTLAMALGVFLLFMVGLIIFVPQYVTLKSRYEKLQTDNQQLWQTFQQLTREYQTATNKLQWVELEYQSLQTQHQELQISFNSLMDAYNASQNSYEVLKETAITPPYIYIRGREVNLSFLLPDDQIYEWKVPFEWLEYDLARGSAERRSIQSNRNYPSMILNNRFTGEDYRVIDYRKFVDPTEFTTFSQFFYERAANEEIFIYDVWFIVAQLTDYSDELSDTPRYPFETLLAGGGDCEDHAILFASMILAAAPQDWDVSLVYMDAYHPTRPEDLNHMIVVIETANRTYTVEATGKQEMEPYYNGVEGWPSLIDR